MGSHAAQNLQYVTLDVEIHHVGRQIYIFPLNIHRFQDFIPTEMFGFQEWLYTLRDQWCEFRYMYVIYEKYENIDSRILLSDISDHFKIMTCMDSKVNMKKMGSWNEIFSSDQVDECYGNLSNISTT